jgi:hypothetical protein
MDVLLPCVDTLAVNQMGFEVCFRSEPVSYCALLLNALEFI